MRIAIVGAGVGGLATAARLAKAGLEVDLFETGPRVGGKMQVVHNSSGLRWDTGPTLVTLPDEIKDTFDHLSDRGGVPPELVPVREGTHVHFADGSDWALPAPGQSLSRWMENVGSRLARECAEVLKVAADVYAFANDHVLHREPPGLVELGLKTTLGGLALRTPDLARLDYLRFVQSRLTDPRARELFLHFSSYVGILPEHATASLISIAHVEFGMPVVFPRGGVYEIAAFLRRAAEAHGVRLRTDAKVTSARPVGGSDTRNGGWEVAWTSAGGEPGEGAGEGTSRYEALVVATDPHQALVDWLDSPTLRRHWYGDVVEGRLAPSESQFVVLLERAEESPLAHHVKIFPDSWTRTYRQVVLEKRLPEDPCVYAVWPHATDPSVSPRILFLSAMAPSLDSGHSWDQTQCEAYTRHIRELAERRLGRALPGRVVGTVSPMDLYRGTGALRGGLYGAAPTRFRQVAFARASSFSRVPRLYFVGGGVHPGPGVPMVLKGARRVATRMVSEFLTGGR
jgi:diapolycopene oxygenase